MIPLVDLKAQYHSIKKDIDKAIKETIESSNFIMGERVKKFEKEFAEYCGIEYCVGVSSGTTALHLALLSCGIKEGDEVITTPLTFFATIEPLMQIGARIKLVDIELDNYNIDVTKLENVLSDKTKAIIPVHLYGNPVDMDQVISFAQKHNLKVIEDAAQAHGAEFKGTKIGSYSNATCFSFFPGKNLGAYGDAGAIITNDKEIYEKTSLLRDHGRNTKYEHSVMGFSYRLDALQAAILSAKLKHLDEWIEKRIRNAKLYNKLIKNAITPIDYNYIKHVYHQYVIRHKNRDGLQSYLEKNGIATGIHYPVPLHLQPACKELGYKKGDFPNAEIAAKEILSIPVYPELGEDNIRLIAEKINNYVSDSP